MAKNKLFLSCFKFFLASGKLFYYFDKNTPLLFVLGVLFLVFFGNHKKKIILPTLKNRL